MFFGCDARDVLLDVWVDALMNERDLSGMSGDDEIRPACDGDVHRGTPFDAQSEPEHGLCAERATMSAHVGRAGAVHRSEGPPERLDRSVAVAHCHVQQVRFAEREVRPGQRHTSTARVLRQRHLRQRREHPAQVKLGRAVLACKAATSIVSLVFSSTRSIRAFSVPIMCPPFEPDPRLPARIEPDNRGHIRSDPDYTLKRNSTTSPSAIT